MNEEKTTTTTEEHTREANNWHRTNADPEAYATSGGYGLARLGTTWTVCFATVASVRSIQSVEEPEEVPPFCWARKIVDELQEKRQYGGWSEQKIKGKPGEENTDVSVPKELVAEARTRKSQRLKRGRR